MNGRIWYAAGWLLALGDRLVHHTLAGTDFYRGWQDRFFQPPYVGLPRVEQQVPR